MMNRYFFLYIGIISLVFCIFGCRSTSGCSERKLVIALLEQMTLQPSDSDDGIFVDSECLYFAAEALEKLLGYKRHTKFGHWGEYYDNSQILKLDSLSYASILAKLTKEELHQKVNDNCFIVVEALSQGCCIENLQNVDYDCYMYFLDMECSAGAKRVK